ncbi:MAG TPA: hypothetical protein VJN70_14375 [Gemmatimonadaceae bacterium]|nr:hypothetical protein [Gemmatimonadaceae bacterium]
MLNHSREAIAAVVIACTSSLGTVMPARAQTASPRYASRAPIEQYRLKSQTEEIALARTAAPPSVSANAEVLVLGEHGYETAVKGTNGFVCFVERGWAAPFDDPEFWSPTPRAPNCFNATAARTELPQQLKRTEWALSGASKEEIMKRTRSAYAEHTFKTPEPGAMTYMLSKDTRNSAGDSWLPHLMFFVPAGQTSTWGACENSYPIICWRGDEIQSTVFLIPVRAWSDGSPAPPVAVQHAQMKK